MSQSRIEARTAGILPVGMVAGAVTWGASTAWRGGYGEW